MNHARIIRLQRQILTTVRADVRKALGPQSKALQRYYEGYKREFRGNIRHSNKEELLKACLKSDLVLMGDYHTFAQSQKAALQILSALEDWDVPLAMGLEMVPSKYQIPLNEFLAGTLDEKAFLKAIDYETNWGFPWEQFRAIFQFAKDNNILTLGLNSENDRLESRDEHAAEIIANFVEQHPKHKVFVLYGDLHLARGHIPKFLKSELRKRGLKRRTLTIFQNSETLYWKLSAQKMEHVVDVLALGRNRYCIMNAAPWVKLQSYLQWAEQSRLLDHDEGGGMHLYDVARDRLRNLADALMLNLPDSVDFTIQTVNNLSFLNNSTALSELNREELKIVKYHILGNRSIFIPQAHVIYLASESINAMCEGVSMFAYSVLSRSNSMYYDPKTHFFSAILRATIAYFGSKILNHKRKCDLEDDFRLLLERPITRRALPQEKLQRRVAKVVLMHCRAQRDFLRDKKIYRATFSQKGPGRISVFLESSRCLGAMLGEKLYASFIDGTYPAPKAQRLFTTDLSDGRKARALYLKLVTDLESAPLAHTSKMDLF